jgi:hypothetical protein
VTTATTVTISRKSAELIRDWLRDLCSKLHVIPEGREYNAFEELHGQIEDSHYAAKQGTMEAHERYVRGRKEDDV